MTEKQQAILWLDCFMKNKEPLVLMPKTLIRLMYDVLKNEEAVEPIPPTDESDLWKCGNCNHQLFRATNQRYCEMCGRKVKWK